MNRFISMLNDGSELVSDFWSKFCPVFRYVAFAIVIACSIVLTITTLMQSNDSSNALDAYTGKSQESYYSQNKGASRDAILKRITIAMAVIIFVMIILFFVSELIYGSRGWEQVKKF